MEKIKINLDIVLPGVPDEKDECVSRLITAMQGRKGIDKVHVVPETEQVKAQLCFHYDPQLISMEEIQKLAEKAGASITERFGHLMIEVRGIRYVRHARIIETSLKGVDGILSVAVSPTGWIRLEFDAQKTSPRKIYRHLKKAGLQVVSPEQVLTPEHKHVHITKEELHVEGNADKVDEKPGEEHVHDHKEGESHDHAHGGIFGEKTELIFSLICGALLATGFGISFVKGIAPIIPILFYAAAYFFGGFFTMKEAIESIAKGGFEIDFLMLVAAIGAAILGNWEEGALLLFLFSLGHSLEHFAMGKAKKSIEALANLSPKTALLKEGEGTKEVKIEELKAGDIIVVKPNTTIAADGIIVNGNSSVNQAPITGESMPVDKTAVDNPDIDIQAANREDASHKVFAGTINGNGSLEIKVTKTSAGSAIARLIKMVNEAQTQKSPTQQFTDRFEKYFVPAVLILVVLLCFAFVVIDEPFSKSFYRAMAVLVAASPCALAISTPSAVLSGVARAARAGVLIKGGRPLEDLGSLTALAFDKTGTLTEGKPKLTQVIPLNNINENDQLKAAIAIEELSDHPLAKAIVKGGKERLGTGDYPKAENLEAVLGKGITATLGGAKYYAGNLALFNELDEAKPTKEIIEQVQKLEREGNTTMLFRKDKGYIGIIALMDTPRGEAKQALEDLKAAGIKRMVMLTGDNQQVADAVAKQTGLTEAWGGLLPEQKVEAIKKLMQEEKKVAMVGDGVNDAPAMANSTVGIAMGAAGSDVALETADIALMEDKLQLLPFAIGLSRQSKRIIKQNLVISLGMVAILIPLTILGIAHIGPAVIAHEGSTLLVVFNALRLLAYKSE